MIAVPAPKIVDIIPKEARKLATVVICSRDRAPFLERCLEGLHHSNRDFRLPILVIDNGSTDRTSKILGAHTSYDNFNYEFVAKPGLSVARNVGLRKVTTPYIVYLDDDAIPAAGWVNAFVEGIYKYRPHIFGGPYRPYYLDKKKPWFLNEFGSAHLDLQEGEVSGKECFSGGNMGWSTQLLKDLGGFDPELGMIGDRMLLGEETALQLKFSDNPKICRVFLSGMLMTHYVSPSKMRLRYIAKRSFTYGWQLINIDPSSPVIAKSRISGFLRRTRGGLPLMVRLLIRNRKTYPHWKTYAAKYLSLHMIEAGILYRSLIGRDS